MKGLQPQGTGGPTQVTASNQTIDEGAKDATVSTRAMGCQISPLMPRTCTTNYYVAWTSLAWT